MIQRADYRSRIYERYSTCFKDAKAIVDREAVQRWGRAYRFYLRGWLPAEPNARIADLGCGNGALLAMLQADGYCNSYGVDISAEQVALARQVCKEVYEESVFAHLARVPGSCDAIVALDLIEHFNKDEAIQFLDACFQGLKPGGRLILQTPNADSPFGASLRYGDFTHEVAFTPDAMARLLRMTGFADCELREMGPIPIGYSVGASGRFIAWQVLRGIVRAWWMVETGHAGTGVLSRVFLAKAVRETDLDMPGVK